MKEKFIKLYIDFAKRVSELSQACRLKVGAIIVKEDRVISIGYNGMPAGWENDCEIKLYQSNGQINLTTKPEVLHAESNALAKVARSTESSEGATLFCTHAPCIECAKLIYQSGISQVYYELDYRSADGIDFLRKSRVRVIQLTA
jgi:dCMP deaminase